MSKVSELEELKKRLFKVGVAAMKAGEYELASELQDALRKIQQKIDGHKAQRRKKRGK